MWQVNKKIKVLGLDIGGAHIKYAVAQNQKALLKRKIIPFEIYRTPKKLAPLLKAICKEVKPSAIALSMTGELADVFVTRREGVKFILNAAVDAFGGNAINVLTVKGSFVSVSVAMKQTELVSAANFMATVLYTASIVDNSVVVDIGSTTTDILPVINWSPAILAHDDLGRLKSGELFYGGYLRTNASSVLQEISIGKTKVGTCPEFFATVGDAHLYSGDITAKDYTCQTPDGGPKTKRGAGIRLARLILSDPQTLSAKEIESIARQIVKAQTEKIADAIKKLIVKRKMQNAKILLTGAGAKVYRVKLARMIKNPFPGKVNGIKVENISPASASATKLLSAYLGAE
ncbi:hypothetical protein MNBD_NITROSPINAE01-898 [hydrothermal vent metagenome]|uniref:Hydantoinase A/oxoprolinase domain-containing protein n=1 Tax=hydrothermal vent metagenome TaxID=652676 RepID=A0A3B1CN33_9ZZZZ